MTTPNPGAMTPQRFIDKWIDTTFGERQASQEWFNDLCRLVGHPTPAEFGDPDNFTFEKWVPGGYADAYKQAHFGWEFKGDEAQLTDAFNQLQRYQNHLQTPPLLVVSSFTMIRARTNFNGKEMRVHEIPIASLTDAAQLEILRLIFHDPAKLEPGRTVEEVTQDTARLFAKVAEYMEGEDVDAERLARYLNQLALCLYAENTELLPDGVFTKITGTYSRDPAGFNLAVRELFAKMSAGGLFGMDVIPYFNGELFDGSEPVELNSTALLQLYLATSENWRNIEPSIFGTLFERALDAVKRSSYGTHYTSADDIMLVIEPVLMKPLRREWNAAKSNADALLADGKTDDAFAALDAFRERLTNVTVLDPACGSGNFLYIALRSLLDLEKEVIDYAESGGRYGWTPRVSPTQMYGLELDTYAAELARTSLWIGYIQWHYANGVAYTHRPVLMPLDTISRTDAILAFDHDGNPVEPQWPDTEFIVGNPPFLGRGYLRSELKDEYTDKLYELYAGRLPHSSDLCCYWLEKARAQIAEGKTKRAGLLATQGIRGRDNRIVLQRIKDSGGIFMAYSDEVWKLAGAMVHISIIGFDDGSETEVTLDGKSVDSDINANLTIGVDTTSARKLRENRRISFEGPSPKAPFDIPANDARRMLEAPINVNGKLNSDVIRPVLNARDITQHPRGMYTIDFNMMEFDEACQYEMPFEHVAATVKPIRLKNRSPKLRSKWWRYGNPGVGLRQALQGLSRYIATPRVSKHRLFVWVDAEIMSNDSTDVFASDDDYFFGVLHSRTHELWARSKGTQLREVKSGFRYTPTTCFETFPFPRPTDEQRAAIAAAAKRLDELRRAWLHPSATDMLGDDSGGAAGLRNRTLTGLYNANPHWLRHAHAALDDAVAAAYGWTSDMDEQETLRRLLDLNLQRYEDEQG